MADFKPTISHIVCTDRLGVIGYSNKLPWHIPEELEYFKNKTKDSIIVMGNNTYKSLRRPLPNRINIVVGNNPSSDIEDSVYFLNDLDEALIKALDIAEEKEKNIFIIGGSSIYKQTFDIVDNIFLSVININLKYHHDHASEYTNFVYYPIEEHNEEFKIISNQTLHTTSTVNTVKVFELVKDTPDENI